MNKFSAISAKLEQFELDAMIITSAPGERYAIGMRGEGVIIVSRDAVHFSTDGRYIESAKANISDAEIHQVGGGKTHLSLAHDFLTAHNLVHVGFESGYMSVDSHLRWAEGLPACIFTPAQQLIDDLRASKDPQELEHMRHAQRITDETFTEILNFIHVGVTEQEIAARLVYEMMLRGARKPSFDVIVAAGANGSHPHAIPGDRIVEHGMFVTMDFGCMWQGYCSDMTRTIAVGKPTQEMERVYSIVLAAQRAGISTAKAGIAGRDVDAAARQVIEAAGYGAQFSHGFGHSLGLEIHESPNASPAETRLLPVGAVISAEPGIYLPAQFGVRIEDVLIIQDGGCENITQSPKELIVL